MQTGSQTDVQVVGDLVELGATMMQSSDVSFGQGTTNAWDESRWLILSTLDFAIDSDDTVFEEKVSAENIAVVMQALRRRIEFKEPTAYIAGVAWLKGYGFHVSEKVIIPRSFIAELLIDRLKPWVSWQEDPSRILDLCTGSGCLAIIAADVFHNAQVYATDISPQALEVAQENRKAYGLENRITLKQSDLFCGLDSAEKFDLIICNPPYVPLGRKAEMPQEFSKEPALALYAADEGMALVRQILKDASRYLSANGILVLEIGAEHAACEALLAKEFQNMPVLWVETEEQSGNVFIVDRNTLLKHPWRPHR